MSQSEENPQGFDDSEYSSPEQEEQAQAAERAIVSMTQAEDEELSSDDLQDIDLRLETADYYRAVLKHSFFDVEGPASRIVDKEIRVFIRGRLEVLVGLKAPPPAQEVQQQLPFTPEQIEALKALSNKVLGKPQLLAVTPKKPQQVQVAQVQKAKPVVRTISAPAPAPSTKAAPKQQAAPAAKTKAAPPAAKKTTKPAPKKNAKVESFIDHSGSETTLVEGEIIEENGKKFRVEKNDAGTLYRKDITEQARPVNALPAMTYQQMNSISESWAQKNVASAGELTGMAVLASLSPS